MQKVIISDTSCLILLQNIGEIDLLNKLFGTVVTTKEVADEFGLPLPPWIQIHQPLNKRYQSIIEASVHKGEASTIALAIENDNSLLIVDDLKARKFAQNLGINITGTIGIIVDAKLEGVIPSVRVILNKIKQTNFRITPKLELMILEKSNELK